MEFEIYQINTFTNSFKGGNPAGVCPLDEWIDDNLMQAIAKENGYSETAFFVPNGSQYDLRWFTPGCEVDLCGHATLASAFVLATQKDANKTTFDFRTKSGMLKVGVNGDAFVLDMPSNKYEEVECPSCLVNALGQAPKHTFLTDDYMVVYEDEEFVTKLIPNFTEIKKIDARGTIVTAAASSKEVDFVSRWFGGPDVGVDEDPVTGSAHCTLIPYWSERLGRVEMKAVQCSTRGGELGCKFLGDRVQVQGEAVMYLKGVINI